MPHRSHPLVLRLFLVCCIALPALSPAAVVFRPGKKARYVTPGEEEISGNAQRLFEMGQQAEASRDFSRAIKNYRVLVRRYPKDTLAAGAAYRYAVLQEQQGDPLKAAAAYRVVVENYPKSPNFSESIEAQFRIGEKYLNGKKVKLLGVPIKASMDKAIEIFAAIVRTAPYGKYTARAQFNIGLATEKQGNAEGAVAAYTAVAEKFPDSSVAADAQYQIGYLWFAPPAPARATRRPWPTRRSPSRIFFSATRRARRRPRPAKTSACSTRRRPRMRFRSPSSTTNKRTTAPRSFITTM